MPSSDSFATRTLGDGRKTVASSATAEALTTTPTRMDWVDVIALGNNTGNVAVGDASVDAGTTTQRGYLLAAGDVATLYDVDISTVYVDVVTNAEGVTWVGVSY